MAVPLLNQSSPPPHTAILNIPEQKQKEMDRIPLIQLAHHTEKRSRFYGYAARAYTFDFINLAYLKMRQMHPTANHIMAAYTLDSDVLGEDATYGACNDGESHSDVKLTETLNKTTMSNVVVFVVRYYGGIQLRGLRLKIIADCAKAALHKLRFPDGVPPGDAPATTKHQNNPPQATPQNKEHSFDDSSSLSGSPPGTPQLQSEHSYGKPSFTIRGGHGPRGKGSPSYRPNYGSPLKKSKLSMAYSVIT